MTHITSSPCTIVIPSIPISFLLDSGLSPCGLNFVLNSGCDHVRGCGAGIDAGASPFFLLTGPHIHIQHALHFAPFVYQSAAWLQRVLDFASD
jgi:hypothetical protein